MLALSLRQILDEFLQQEDTTLYTDETTKFGTKLSGYHKEGFGSKRTKQQVFTNDTRCF